MFVHVILPQQDEVSQTEDEIELQQQQQQQQEEERQKKAEELKKLEEKVRLTLNQLPLSINLHFCHFNPQEKEAAARLKPSVLYLTVDAPPVRMASPETRRRADQMKLKVHVHA